MKPYNSLIFIISFCLALFSSASLASNSSPSKLKDHGGSSAPNKHSKPHWSYSGSEGPGRWGSLASEYSTCSAGPATTYNNILVSGNNLLPANKSYYYYRGSLTTPPCREGVRWFVMQNNAQVSQSQVHKFNYSVGNNNRPIQARNNRFLLRNQSNFNKT